MPCFSVGPLAALVVCCWAGLAAADDAPGPPAPRRPSLRVDRSVFAPFVKGLDRRIDVDFTRKPLDEAVAFLAEEAEVAIRFDEIALEEEAVTRDQPVSIRRNRVRIGDALDELLEPLGLTVIVRAETLLVTSRIVGEELGNHEIGAYDLGPQLVTAQPGDADEIIEVLLRTTGELQSWEDVGGPASVTVLGRRAVIRATQRTHREVGALLAGMDAILRQPPGQPMRRLFVTDDQRRIERALGEELSVRFTDVPLRDAMQRLGEALKCDITIDRVALEEEGIPIDEPLSLVVADVPARSVLAMLFEPLGLTYQHRYGSLRITSTIVADEQRNQTITLFDVRDLLDAGHDLDSLVDLFISTGRTQTWEDTGLSRSYATIPHGLVVVRDTDRTTATINGLLAEIRQSRLVAPPENDDPSDPMPVRVIDCARIVYLPQMDGRISPRLVHEDPDEVAELIRTFVPGGWGEPDGGRIRRVGHQLFVRTTPGNHDRIDALTIRIRSAVGHAGEIAPPRVPWTGPGALGSGIFRIDDESGIRERRRGNDEQRDQ